MTLPETARKLLALSKRGKGEFDIWDDPYEQPVGIGKISDIVEVCEGYLELWEEVSSKGIHTCHIKCRQPMCVLRRENEELKEKLRKHDNSDW